MFHPRCPGTLQALPCQSIGTPGPIATRFAMLIEMSQKVVIVTGGCQGIGRGIATRFLGEGAEVVVCARHPPATPVSSGGRTATFIAADVREPDQVEAVVKGTVEHFGTIDVLVNNAGGS